MRFLIVSFLAFALSVAAAQAAPPMSAIQLPPQPKIHPAGIPKDALMLSPCVQMMGEHWGVPKTMPLGPLYGVSAGKPIFTEIMVSQKQFAQGFSYDNIQALPGYHIDHVNVEFVPHGHPGFMTPHYDIHAYYISAAAQAQLCPDGIPDPSMKPKMP